MKNQEPQIKLFVILAQAEPTAVILRRGPSKWFHVIQWDTRRDIFTHGAWIKGRIYEDKCDLSPDGRLFVYSVLQGSRSHTDFTHVWTAISRPPWLHALSLWPQSSGTYGGGGRFINDTLVLRGVGAAHKDFPLPKFSFQNEGLFSAPLHVKSDDVPDADWCGRDQRGFIIFTRDGQLFRRKKLEDQLLADFTNLVPNPEPAPDWATRRM